MDPYQGISEKIHPYQGIMERMHLKCILMNLAITKRLIMLRSSCSLMSIFVVSFLIILFFYCVGQQPLLDHFQADVQINMTSQKLFHSGDHRIQSKFTFNQINNLRQDDHQLIQIIQSQYLNPPSNEPYNLTAGNDVDPSMWQAGYVKGLLRGKRNGFFVECGAHDGEFLSNTLMLERKYGWEGLLIEVFPSRYQELLTKHRKAWTIPACISNDQYAGEAMMKTVKVSYGEYWAISKDPVGANTNSSFRVQCFPFYSILMALNRTKIDYLSLDVEGNELNVFKTIPWDKVNITVVSAEFNNLNEGKNALREFMEAQGYKLFIDGSEIVWEQNIDFIFYHPKLLPYKL